MKKFKCPICRKTYVQKPALYSHIEKEHPEDIPKGISVARFYFNYRYGKTHGKCIMCGKETPWNEKAEKYDRLCGSKKCSDAFREMFKARMKKAGKENIMNDPEHQKKMLAARKISGKYKYQGKEIQYTGSYEKDFLRYMDEVMKWPVNDIMMPAPQVFKYVYEGKEHFYIPDVYIPTLNLIIEIKSEDNKHYRARDIQIERIKDDILAKSDFNYTKIYDKNYAQFNEVIRELKNN